MGQYSGHKFDNCVIEVLTQQHGSNTINFKEPIKEIKNEEEMEKEFNDMEEMGEGVMDSPIKKSKKHPLNNTVIKSLNNEHGANIIKWWKKQGVDTRLFVGNRIGRYYGLCDGEWSCFSNDYPKDHNLKIITLPNPLMNYCIKGSYDEVRPIYESIGIKSINYGADCEIQYFIISRNEMNAYIDENVVSKIIITPDQAKQMIEEFYAPEPKVEVKEDKPTYPYLAKVWNNNYDDSTIAIVVANIEVGKPKYPILSVCDTDINLFINGEKYDHTWRKNAEPIGYDLESIRTRLDSIESEYKEIEESIQKMNEKLESLKSEHSNLIEAKKLLELMNKAK